MEDRFKDVEEAFLEIRRRFRRKEISRREFIDRLKKLRLSDEQGRFWMIGVQTGKWYYFDGKTWVRSDPPQREEKGNICPECGEENPATVDSCFHCGESLSRGNALCRECGRTLEDPFLDCPHCRPKPETGEISAAGKPPLQEEEAYLLRRLSPGSLFFFWGSLGVALGVILGAFSGASGAFSEFTQHAPAFFRELQGRLMGGIIFAGMGGILGFLGFGLIGIAVAALFNAVSSIIGGIHVTLEKKSLVEKREKERPD